MRVNAARGRVGCNLFRVGPSSSAEVYHVPVTEFKLPLYGADTERGDLAP